MKAELVNDLLNKIFMPASKEIIKDRFSAKSLEAKCSGSCSGKCVGRHISIDSNQENNSSAFFAN